MLPPRTRLDPDGYYDRLGLEPAATRTDVVKAFRAKARLLHPDVPKTGNSVAFVAVRKAYDVLSNQELRAAYDRRARDMLEFEAEMEAARRPYYEPEPAAAPRRPVYRTATATAPDRGPINPPEDPSKRQPRLFDIPVGVWVGLGAFLCLCLYEATVHLLFPPSTVRDDIRPNAAIVAPLSPSAHQAVLYGPNPVQLAGSPNFYVMPAGSPAVLWRQDTEHNTLVPLGQLPPFSSVQAVRLIRQNGMLEVLVNDHASGFISADHLTPGNASAARLAYCSYNAGSAPHDGELLERRGYGDGTIEMENRGMQPAVVKLRDETGAVAMSVFLGPGGHGIFDGLPQGSYYSEFAIGELWSRACNSFAAGMRARRMEAVIKSPGDAHLVLAPDSGEPAATDIPDQAFERK